MKANEAPEKIYLVPFGKPIIEPLPQEGSLAATIWSSKPYANSNAGNIEYTRTDVFIEKACKYLFENYHGEKLTLRRIKGFKNYMETIKR